jgi:hypothetical protein
MKHKDAQVNGVLKNNVLVGKEEEIGNGCWPLGRTQRNPRSAAWGYSIAEVEGEMVSLVLDLLTVRCS